MSAEVEQAITPEMARKRNLPAYALQYAPMLWLQTSERYWPGNPLAHLQHCSPLKRDGSNVGVPADLLGKCEQLKLPDVNQTDVFLHLNENPRISALTEKLTSTEGRPDKKTRRSSSVCWMIEVDKGKIVEPGVVDIFYFFFYPYNLGNVVVGTEFGNHVGDWEHAMVRFKDGQPIAMHLSAHADGHSWAWKTVEKMDQRPVGYVASGSHAMYGKPGIKPYSPVGAIGPIDYTSKGVLWDPALNYCAAAFDPSTGHFTALGPPPATVTTSAAPPEAGPVPSASTTGSSPILHASKEPAYTQLLTPDEIVTVLEYQGRWGDSFSEFRKSHPYSINPFGSLRSLAKNMTQTLSALKWAEGPSGPRWKSLERKGVTWNTEALLPNLV